MAGVSPHLATSAIVAAVFLAWANTGQCQQAIKTVDAEGNVGLAVESSTNAALESRDTEPTTRLGRRLATTLTSLETSGETVNVVYLFRPTADLSGSVRQEDSLAALEAKIASRSTARVEKLEASGHRIIYRARYANVIVAAAPAAGIRTMEADDDVLSIALEQEYEPRLNVSRIASQANVVNSRGIRGSGVRVGVVERARIGRHPNLPADQRRLCRGEVSAQVEDHKTRVTGVVQSTHSRYRGMAPLIEVIDGVARNFRFSQLMAATDCVISKGAVAINMSFGGSTGGRFDSFARYVDETAYNTGRTFIVATSNDCRRRVGSPEVAFNALGVGSYSDRNTIAASDDRHSCHTSIPFSERHSAYKDPLSPNGDREAPHLVAPGHRIMSTSSAGFEERIGTSYAAPHVTGIAGLIRQRAGRSIQNQAERMRAILMASARKNIEGGARLSDRDGAGAVQAAAAIRVLSN